MQSASSTSIVTDKGSIRAMAFSVSEQSAQNSHPLARIKDNRIRGGVFGRISLYLFWCGIIIFFVGSVVGPQFNPIFLKLGYLGVAVMVAISILGVGERWHKVTPELCVFWGFCVWALITGAVVALNLGLFLKGTERVIQIAVIAFCVTGASARLRSPAFGLGSVLVVAILLGIYGLATGDIGSFTEMQTTQSGSLTGVRSTSMVQNANSLGVNAVWGLVAVTYFTTISRRHWVKILLWCCIPILVYSMLASGSRKALLLPAIYLIAWIWFCHRKLIFQRWQSMIPILVLGATLYWGMPWVMENTFVGYRMKRSVDMEHQDGSTEYRVAMYKQAIKLTAEHPFAGIGLYQWSIYSPGLGGYAHNDYGEVAASTGIFGLILYLLPYGMATRRLQLLRKTTFDMEYARAGICLALLTTIAAAGFGQVLFLSQTYWVLVGSVWGYAYGVQPRLSLPAKRFA